MPLRFYASGAPEWWRYHLVSLGNGQLPPRGGTYAVLVDNGMYRFWRLGTRPALDYWYDRLLKLVRELEVSRRIKEIAVILPDWLHDPKFTIDAARRPEARRLCRDYVCYAVAHRGPGARLPRRHGREARQHRLHCWARGTNEDKLYGETLEEEHS